MGRAFVRADFSEPLALARLACAVGDDAPQAEVCSAVLELLDLFDEHLAPPEEGRPIPAAARLLVFALIVARTPDVRSGVPDLPHPTRAEAELHEPKGAGGARRQQRGWVGKRASRGGTGLNRGAGDDSATSVVSGRATSAGSSGAGVEPISASFELGAHHVAERREERVGALLEEADARSVR